MLADITSANKSEGDTNYVPAKQNILRTIDPLAKSHVTISKPPKDRNV